MIFIEPFNDKDLVYDKAKRRYLLTPQYISDNGIDLALQLETAHLANPASAVDIAIERVSILVYENIYQYGRNRSDKEYLLACDPKLRNIIRDAMFERLTYMVNGGDLSARSGAVIGQGYRIEVKDLIPSVVEEMILRGAGLLHRGDYFFIKDESIEY